ncbi:MAG TPA: gamma-glutamyl-gamma-aminobutyrate hydrolase family protein [Bacillota bacterium]|jgi:putative glutamine amidotransferase|nr:gamma-glutamyl-gamma-aminobutyrate hydrolase family protein [Fastidiosipila sp.]HPX93601.1 gamma-glutamyl-gamma-aminobutyrate hydrolase family protein [Bacillota bacterium]HQB80577.1 gamma-glutamyl-gamma-aminobutyrate hydrolase family protein [Bacillota bacterium]
MIRIALSCSLDGVSEQTPDESGQSRVNNAYIESILRAGAAPVPVPVTQEADGLAAIIDCCCGLVLTGGDDISPLLYGEEPLPEVRSVSARRDKYELLLFNLAVERKIPVFGICRGIQLINVALGGSLHQHLAAMSDLTIRHDQEESRHTPTHLVMVTSDSLIHGVLGDQAEVNSFHHQAIKVLAKGLKVTGVSPDGVIEAVESAEGFAPTILGVQWHPEGLSETRPEMAALFKLFVNLCETGHRS